MYGFRFVSRHLPPHSLACSRASDQYGTRSGREAINTGINVVWKGLNVSDKPHQRIFQQLTIQEISQSLIKAENPWNNTEIQVLRARYAA